jgi:hypothetical protein
MLSELSARAVLSRLEAERELDRTKAPLYWIENALSGR